MDELYLEWLRATVGLDRDKARSVAEHFPSLEELIAATIESIAEKTGLSVDDARLLKGKASEAVLVSDGWYRKDPSLFLCPECGSFISRDAKTCPQCGATFEGEEKEVPAEAVKEGAEATEGTPELFMCSNCGAFLSKDSKKCPTCGQEIEEVEGVEAAEEELLPRVVSEAEEGELKVCPECGAFVSPQAKKCGICGRSFEELAAPKKEIVEVEAKEPRGVSQDFLERWRRVAEKVPSREAQLEEELRHYDELLEVDPRLEKAWVLKSHVLRELGRAKEAARCLEKAAQINPSKEEEYKLEVLNLAETLADSSVIPPKWSALTPPEKPKVEVSALGRALSYYDRLLSVDPKLDVAWETRAELLRRMGREAEAEVSLAKAREMRQSKAESERKALLGLRTVGPTRAKAKLTEGRVNGLVNGIGRVNGRVNGLVNGIGRVNGLVNGIGRVNGLVNGVGRVNGLVNGVGRVNGLVNGNGFTNGRRGRFQPVFRPERGWFKSTGVLAAVVLTLLAAPLIASLLAPSPAFTPFRIDGDFADWQGVPERPDALLDTRGTVANLTYRGELDLVATKLASQDGQLALYARANGRFFATTDEAASPTSMDYVVAMVDSDGNPLTGYRIGNIGADYQVRLAGYSGNLTNARLLKWNPGLGGGSNNISAFIHDADIPAAAAGDQLEFIAPIPDPKHSRVLLATVNLTGLVDITDESARIGTSTIAVTQQTIVDDILTQNLTPFLSVIMCADSGPATVLRLNVTKLGSMPDQAVRLSLFMDDGDGVYGVADSLLGTSSVSSSLATFPLDLTVDQGDQVMLFVVAELTGAPDASSLRLVVSSVESNTLVDMADNGITSTYYQRAPAITIDGAFGDWDGSKLQADARWDVRSLSGSQIVNSNVDIAEVGLNLTSDLSFYMMVHGRMLGGEDLPNMAARPIPSGIIDSDRDTVPDSSDLYPHDFNNDGIADEYMSNDVDADGLTDYPDGPDFWVNTTIPTDFPPQYAGRIVSVYVGPLSYNVPTGVDTALAYIDADNSTATGLYVDVDGEAYGVDYALVANGRGGILGNSSLYKYRANSNIPFEWIGLTSAGVDYKRLEMAANATVLGLVPGFKVLAYTTDWMRDSDYLAPVITRGGLYGVRSPAGDNVVINEVFPRKSAWIELANPTASPIALSGWVLQVLKGNKYVTVYTFTTEVIGAWGSGTEYLAVDVASKDLPTANGNLVLRNAGGIVVDSTTYPGVGASETWSRFKGATDGKPVDTDSSADWYISTRPTRGGPNDRTRPIIRVAKTANVQFAQPGEFVVYTIYYNNTGDGLSRRVWVNDTLPANVMFWSSSLPPSSSSGQTYRWTFTNVPPNAQRSFTVTVRVTALAQNGAVQVNTVFGNYTDQLNRRMESSTAWANFTVRRPVIRVEKTASPTVAQPGDLITYTIYFNNTGSIPAGKVWINDTLPNDVTYIGSSVPYDSRDGQTYRWVFTNVGVGPHSFTITAQVNMNPGSSTLVNWVFLNYTSANGYQLEGSSDSALVYIPEFGEVLVPIAIPFVVVLGLRFLRRRREAVADSVPSTSGR